MNPNKPKLQVVHVCVAVGLAMLLLAGLWAGVATAHTLVTPVESGRELLAPLSTVNVITIGVGAMLSAVPQIAWPEVNAAQLAVDQANAAGGINISGTIYNLSLVSADDANDVTQTITAAHTLLNAGAVAVVGHSSSKASLAAQPVYNLAGVPMVSPSSTNWNVTEQGYTTTFRVSPRDDRPPILLVTYLRDWLHLEKAAIIEMQGYEGTTYNISTTFTSLGGTITSLRSVSSSAEFTATLTAIQTEDPDAIFYSDSDPNNAGMVSGIAQSLGMSDVIIAWSTFTEDESVLAVYAAQAGSAAEGDYAVMFYRSPQDMPGYGATNAAYQAAGFPNNGGELTMWGAFAFDATNIVIEAIRSAQSTDPARIRDAIANTADYNGVVGTYIGFDDKGDIIPQWAWLERYTNGQWEDLQPTGVITIGVGAMLSAVPQIAWPEVNAAQLAVDQANAAGGINISGTIYNLSLVSADDANDVTQAITAAQTLLNAGAAAVVGHSSSKASRAAQPVYNLAGVPMVSPSSTNLDVTEQGYTTTFRVCSRDDRPPILLATYLRNWLHLQKAAIVEMQGFQWPTANISTTFTSLGGTITSLRSVSSSDEFTATLTAIKPEDPDVIFYSDPDPNRAGMFSKVSYGVGMNDVIIAWSTFTEDESVLADYAVQAGSAAEGDHAVMFYRRTQDMPGYAVTNAAYQAAGFLNNGGELTMWGAFAFDATNIVIEAIRSAQSTDPARIRDAIANTADYNGVVGTYLGFDDKGDVIPQWAWLERYTNGQWVILQPAQIFMPAMLKNAGP